MRAPCTAFSPMPPQPKTATLLPILTLAALTTAPTPVITPQPSSAALSRGKSGGILTTAASGIVESCANVETPAKCRTGVSLIRKRVVPSGIRPVRRICVPTSHSAGRPPVQYSQVPQDTRQMGITWSPGWTAVTPSPTPSTMPEPSCPRMMGMGMTRSPFITCRSL